MLTDPRAAEKMAKLHNSPKEKSSAVSSGSSSSNNESNKRKVGSRLTAFSSSEHINKPGQWVSLGNLTKAETTGSTDSLSSENSRSGLNPESRII